MEAKKPTTHSEDEHRILSYWKEHRCFEKSVENRPEGDPYVFFDGPPFATGLPHYGHIVASVMKDVVPRYFTMRGKRVERIWGWDCHGLPIENIVQKKHDLKTSEEIEAFGVREFNEACRADVLTYVDEWKKVVERLGRWVDMDHAYHTMDFSFMESVWWALKELWKKDRLYEGRKPMHICPRCETVLSNAEVGQGYADVTDLTVTAKFKLTSGPQKGAFVLAWTTTPWTLPGNVLLAVHPSIEYVVVEIEGDRFIFAKDRMEAVLKGKEAKTIATLTGSLLAKSTYEPLFPVFADHPHAFRVVEADFVTIEEGTGIVHIAPGFGEDDMELGLREDVDPIMHVSLNGTFVPELVDHLNSEGFPLAGIPMKEKGVYDKVDVEILRYLAKKGLLFSKEKVKHPYPHCWRCDTPLLNYATNSWFIKVASERERLLLTNREIQWVPEHMKDGRFGNWLSGARDWAISRSRFWGTPLPFWKSEDGDVLVIGSKQELEELSGIAVTDLHKHIVDDIRIRKDGKEYRRVPEVLDCWFESGAMPFAQLHYPFEHQEQFDAGFPAEFIAEGQDQTRGWFYTLHVLANALFGMPAFKHVVVNGIVLAEDGKKMSKRLKNYPDPMEVMERHGADAVRYYLMSGPVVHAENLRFSEKDVNEVSKKFITIFRNILSFYELYASFDDKTYEVNAEGLFEDGMILKKRSELAILDRWILSRLYETHQHETEAMDRYDLQEAARVLQSFVTDFSTWYVRRSRDRMKVEGSDRVEALATMRSVLEFFAKMMAPFLPFLAELIYQSVHHHFSGEEEHLSVHLELWPEIQSVEQEILTAMGEARAMVSRALDLREEAGIPVKQALQSMMVTLPSGTVLEAYRTVICDEVNVKEMTVQSGELAVALDTTITPALRREGMCRDVVRHVNQLRKESGLTIADRIQLRINSNSEEGQMMLREHEATILSATLADSIEMGPLSSAMEHQTTFKTGEQEFSVGF
ncbi:MAG: isoleucine--tRNA ligase [Patescibacteria group bacterium]|jgi:isoleucyl-tRNA synthetase